MSGLNKIWLLFGASLLTAIIIPYWLLSGSAQVAANTPSIGNTKLRIANTLNPEALIEKPLFNAGRSALAGAVEQNASAMADGAEQQQTAPPLPPEPKLVGVASGRGRTVAIVTGQDGQAKNLKPGESIDGWKLVAVSKSSATFSNGGVRRKLALGYQNTGTGGPAASDKSPAVNKPNNLGDIGSEQTE